MIMICLHMYMYKQTLLNQHLLYQKLHSNMQLFTLSFVEIVIPAEVYGIVTAFRQFYHRLSFTIRHPDLLAQELCVRGVIDQSNEVSVFLILAFDFA